MSISLQAARVNARLSQEALAKVFDVSAATVRNWETGRKKIPAEYLRRLAELSGIPEAEIFLPSQYEKSIPETGATEEG